MSRGRPSAVLLQNWLHTRETLGEITGIRISPGLTARVFLGTVAAEEGEWTELREKPTGGNG